MIEFGFPLGNESINLTYIYNGEIILRKTKKNRLNVFQEVKNMLRLKMVELCSNANALNVV